MSGKNDTLTFFLLDRNAWIDPKQMLRDNNNTGAARPGDQITLKQYSGATVTVDDDVIGDGEDETLNSFTLNGRNYGRGTDIEMDYGFVLRDANGIEYFVGKVKLNDSQDTRYNGSVITEGWDPVAKKFVGPPPAGTTFTLIEVRNDRYPWYDDTSNGLKSVADSRLDPYSNDVQLGKGIGAPIAGGNGGIPCFAAGTMIATDRGERAVETLQAGDLVQTLDSGLMPVVWVGSSRVPAVGANAPVHFMAGAIGNARPLVLSPRHRVLVTGWQAELLFGEAEVLVPARALVNGDTIHSREGGEIDYHHILLDRHELLISEGVPTESFFPESSLLDDVLADPEGALRESLMARRAEGEAALVRPLVRTSLARAIRS